MYQIMFYGGLAGTFIFLITSVVVFVKNDVLKRIGDLTGHNAKKAIEELNKKGSQKISMTEAIHPETSKILVHSDKTEDEKESKKSAKIKKKHLRKKAAPQEVMDMSGTEDQETDILPSRELSQVSEAVSTPEKVSLEEEEKTDVLRDNEVLEPLEGDVTELLMDDATELLMDGATELLVDDETELLTDNATELLADDETELLAVDDATELLYEEVHISTDGFNSILNGATDLDVSEKNDADRTDLLRFEVWEDAGDEDALPNLSDEVLQETEETYTTVLADNTKHKEKMEDIEPEEISSMPAIFQVEEDITMVHTEDRI